MLRTECRNENSTHLDKMTSLEMVALMNRENMNSVMAVEPALPEIAKNAVADACTGSNPLAINAEQMEQLLKCCYYDLDVDF